MKTWSSVALGEIFDIARGGSPRPIQQFITSDPDGINWIMIGDASEDSRYITSTKKRILRSGVSKSRVVNPGDFLLTNSMSFGHPYIMKTSGCIHDGWLVLSAKENNIDQNYFYHLLGSNTVYREFSRRAAGTTVKNLNIDLVRGVKINLPSLEEQKRIAAILDKADAIRRKRKKAIRLTEELLRSTFLDMFGNISRNDKNWKLYKIGTIGDVKLGRQRAPKYQTGKYTTKYLRVANVYEDKLALDDILSMDFTPQEKEIYLLKNGDILLNEGQSTELVGRPAIWRNELEECCFQNTLIRFRATPQFIISEYALDAFLAYFRYGEFAKISSKTSNVAHLGASRFSNLMLPVPSLRLQQKWKHFRNSHYENKRDLQIALEESNNLFNSLLQKAFRGEL